MGGGLVRAALAEGFDLRVIARAGSDRSSLAGLSVEWVEADLLDAETLNDAFAGCTLVFHAAGIFSYWDTPGLEERILAATRHVMEQAARQGVRGFIHTSSAVAVGATRRPVALDAREDRPLPDDPIYVRAKRREEKLAVELAAKLGLELRIVCPSLVIGSPDHRLSEGNRMILSYLKDPWKSTWLGGVNLVHVEDVARAMLLVAARGEAGQRYLVAGENLHWREVHSLISELAGLPGPFLTGNHTAAYLAALWAEARARLSNDRPDTTREQAKMVGNYYWYDAGPLRAWGWQPLPAKRALANALAGMLGKPWIPAPVRAEMELSEAVRAEKANMGYAV